MSNVAHELDSMRKAKRYYWQPVQHCFQGQYAVKEQRTRYLPAPTCDPGTDASTSDRYEAYLTRAIFYNVVGRTARGFTGLVFNKDPQILVPDRMSYVHTNIDGSGTGIQEQSAKQMTNSLLYGRGALYTHFPRTGGGATVKEANEINPTIHRYEPEDILNWRVAGVGTQVFTSLVVLREKYVAQDDGFAETKLTRYRELRMVRHEGALVCRIQLWELNDTGAVATQPSEVSYPKDAKGNFLDHIPCYPVGSEANNWDIDIAPLYDMAILNLGHYRNSADYEESVYTVGQPTYVAMGLTQAWVDQNLKGKFSVGSRTMLPLPKEADAKILQPDPNTMAKEAMEMKEAQMTALGAKLVEQRTVARTATETSGDVVVDNSILAVCARNVNSAYRLALQDAALYLGVEFTDDHYYELNTDYDTRRMTAQERQQLVDEFVKGAITFEEMRYNFKRSGVAYLDDDEALKKVRDQKDVRLISVEADIARRPAPTQTGPTPGDTGTGGG